MGWKLRSVANSIRLRIMLVQNQNRASSLEIITALSTLQTISTRDVTPKTGIISGKSRSVSHMSQRYEYHFQDAERCVGWLAAEMPDLNTESPTVVQALHQWVSTMVRHFDIDFLRVDTVKHVRKNFWPDFVAAAGVPAMGEVLHGGKSTRSLFEELRSDYLDKHDAC